ncbi:MAG TPA: ROK family protein [bacterium]|nr:ROK family protein [bacterium]
MNTEFIFQQAETRETEALATIDETVEHLAIGIVSIANIIDPEIVIIGGGVSAAGGNFIKTIEQKMKNYAIKQITKNLRVIRAKLGNDAGIVGAIILAEENSQ